MCPSGQDQTERGPQQWHLLAPRKKLVQAFPPNASVCTKSLRRGGTPRNLLFTGEKNQMRFWEKLARPVESAGTASWAAVGRPVVVTRNTRSLRSSAKMPSMLEGVPREVLDMVLGCLGKRDMVAVGLCSGELLSIVLRYVEADLRKAAAPFAGTEIACTGSYLQDLPEPFERNGLALGAVDRDWLAGGNMCLARRINWASVSAFDKIENNQGSGVWLDAVRAFQGKTGRKSKGRYKKLDRILTNLKTRLHPVDCPEGQSWLLRNLTTKDFVRLRRTGELGMQVIVAGASGGWCRLDDVLLMRICWTNSVDVGQPGQMRGQVNPRTAMDFGRGEWAGHCFDVVMMGLKSLQESGWADVTGQILKEANVLRFAKH